MNANISDSEALSLAKRYHYFKARSGHSWEKKAWVEQLKIQVKIIESLPVQEKGRIFASHQLVKEYLTLKVQLNTAMTHVLHS